MEELKSTFWYFPEIEQRLQETEDEIFYEKLISVSSAATVSNVTS